MVTPAQARRWAALPLVTVPRLLPNGGTVICIGSGPSLTEDDARYCEGKATVIAVCDTYRYAPFAAAIVANDAQWWQVHRGVPDFAGLKYCLEPSAVGRWPGVDVLRNTGAEGVELEPLGLRSGCNSGAAALNLAVHFGASLVLLLGYDCGPDRKGKQHFFGLHPSPLRNNSQYGLFRQKFGAMVAPLKAAGVSVVNCSRVTALECWPRQPLRDALAACEVAA